MSFLAFQDSDLTPAERARELGFFDNEWPGSFTLPFGDWMVQLVKWVQFNPVTSTMIDIVEWPFSTLFSAILSDQVGRNSITTVPWLWLVVGVFLLGSFTRNTRVGLSAASMLALCGFLGSGAISGDFWFQTSRTIGMVIVSVLLCAIVGIPLGILSGRVDGVWTVVRPTLDAMQVIHSFVYMLPFIFFFGIGEVSATMVTMVFALPPIVRLTNLGIRQVPEDVVEASRAYGAPEWRVLTDVQIPLARPAILTGLNQTLLLAFSMLGIAALMGAEGLGKLLFRAINNFDLRLAAGAGLAFFLLAVMFDRITQTEDTDGMSFMSKLTEAWRYRSDPEALLEARSSREVETAEAEEEEPAERLTPVEPRERMGLLLGALGSLVALVSVLLPWANDAGLVSSWGRLADLSLPGESFNGLSASGGTFFGIFVAVFGFLGLLAFLRPLLSFPSGISQLAVRLQGLLIAAIVVDIVLMWLLNLVNVDIGFLSVFGLWMFAVVVLAIGVELYVDGTPRLGSDGAAIAAFAVLGGALGYLFLQGGPGIDGYSHGIGVYLALIGGAVALVGGLMAVNVAPYASRRPLPLAVSTGRILAAVVALLLVLGGAFLNGNASTKTEFGWFFDLRDEFASEIRGQGGEVDDVAVPDEASGEELLETELPEGLLEALDSTQAGVEVDDIVEEDSGDFVRLTYTGTQADGPKLGTISLILAGLALLVAIPASGAMGGGETMRWKASTVLAGLGLALAIVPAGFIFGIVRVADPGALSGIGAFVTLVAGMLVFASGRSVVGEFRRRKIYAESMIETDAIEAIDEVVMDEAALQSS